MGRVVTSRARLLANSETTESEFDRLVSPEHIKETLIAISSAPIEGKSCYVFGMGGHPKSSYEEIRKLDGTRVLFCRSLLGGFLGVLSGIVASYEGLVKITDPARISEVFLKLAERSMVGLYIFDPVFEDKFQHLAMSTDRSTYDFSVKGDPGYVMYFADMDSVDGIVEIVSFGRESPWKAAV